MLFHCSVHEINGNRIARIRMWRRTREQRPRGGATESAVRVQNPV